MQVQAKTKFSGISAQKTRLVLNEMRGRPAQEALAVLALSLIHISEPTRPY